MARIGAGVAAVALGVALGGIAPRLAAQSLSATLPLTSLPGWTEDDHRAAISAVRAACPLAPDVEFKRLCAKLPTAPDEETARRFLEQHFVARTIDGEGRLTGYYMPIYPARLRPAEDFSAPVRPPPGDLPPADRTAAGRSAYADRAAIESRPATDALAWMRPEDLFFMQIQGAGVLALPGGERVRAVFAGANGARFVGVAKTMTAAGLLDADAASASAIHDWLADHRGAEAQAIMDTDPRYVFYRLESDDGQDPAGSAGLRLLSGRAIAVDPAYHRYGELLWIAADAPTLAGAFPTYRRLTVALDTGSAIKGPDRVDLYVGRGAAAGAEAGRIRHDLRLYLLEAR
ncbi:MAG TPA: MltA domain-containing protein [Caulobacteraceae bacterium]